MRGKLREKNMRHTFLCQPGLWNATGVYLDPDGNESQAGGTMRVAHEQGRWQTEGVLDFAETPAEFGADQTDQGLPGRFQWICQMEPFPENGFQTEWMADSDRFGHMKGITLTVSNALVSTGESSDGRYVLSEWQERINEDHYVARGVILDRGRRVAAWALHMERSMAAYARGTDNRISARA